MVLFTDVRSEIILHVLESLPLEEDIDFIIFDLHYMWRLAIYQDDSIAEF
jgi:hypothetical protein